MKKFMILYNSSASASEIMAQATDNQVKASMAEWIEWKKNAEKSAKVEFGMPLEAKAKVASDRVGKSENPAGGYSIIEAENSDVVVELVRDHPHLKRPAASIDVLEFMPMPGM